MHGLQAPYWVIYDKASEVADVIAKLEPHAEKLKEFYHKVEMVLAGKILIQPIVYQFASHIKEIIQSTLKPLEKTFRSRASITSRSYTS